MSTGGAGASRSMGGETMSLPERLENIPHVVCSSCGKEIGLYQIPLCQQCRADLHDMYADEAVQDRLEGRRK